MPEMVEPWDLEDRLSDMAVIRTTLETLDLFTEDDSVHDEMREIVMDARRVLLERFGALRDVLANNPDQLEWDLSAFKKEAISLMTRGIPRRNLDRMMKTDAFIPLPGEDAAVLYHFGYAPADVVGLRLLSPAKFLLRLLDDLLGSISDRANYTDKAVFDREVFRRFIGLMFLRYCCTDPMFYGSDPLLP